MGSHIVLATDEAVPETLLVMAGDNCVWVYVVQRALDGGVKSGNRIRISLAEELTDPVHGQSLARNSRAALHAFDDVIRLHRTAIHEQQLQQARKSESHPPLHRSRVTGTSSRICITTPFAENAHAGLKLGWNNGSVGKFAVDRAAQRRNCADVRAASAEESFFQLVSRSAGASCILARFLTA